MTFVQLRVENFMKMLDNRSANAVVFVQNYSYLSLDEVLCIYCATHSVNFLALPFVQLKWKRKMAARYFFNGYQKTKVVTLGTCLLGPVQYDRTSHRKRSKLLNIT